MSAAEKWDLVTVEDYLDGEEISPVKHEYCEGVVYAMAGGRNVHNRIAGRVFGLLYTQLQGRRCQPCNSDTKVRIRFFHGIRFYYPDAFVVCHPNSPDDTFEDAPVVIVEVTSSSTRRIDLGEKKDAYLTIPTLAAYLVVESGEAAVQVFRRSSAGDFQREVALGPEALVELPEIGVVLPLADLYEGVVFEEERDGLHVAEGEVE